MSFCFSDLGPFVLRYTSSMEKENSISFLIDCPFAAEECRTTT